MTDPHSHPDNEEQRGHHGHQHGNHGHKHCGCSCGDSKSNDPHSFSDHHTPEYEGSREQDRLYPAGAEICTTSDWGRVYLSVGEVLEASVLEGGAVRIVVRVGDREKAVWGEGSSVDDLPGKKVLVVDNLEALRVRNEVFNGKVLTVGGSVVVVDAPEGTRVI